MKAEYKQRWVEALRSGDYEQATGKLTIVDDNGNKSHCCLGLLCELVKDDLGLDVKEVQRVVGGSALGYMTTDEYGDESFATAVLSRPIEQAVGLSRPFNGVPEYNFNLDPSKPVDSWADADVQLHLSSLNDEGFTFSQIADIIEWAEPED